MRTLQLIIRFSLLVVIALLVVITALDTVGINVAPLLAGASILGLALGFGSQKLVQDFITGIFLLIEDAMDVGDWVTLAGVRAPSSTSPFALSVCGRATVLCTSCRSVLLQA